MTAQSPASQKSLTPPLLVWLLIQLATLVLGASQVALSAASEQPSPLHEMLLAQIVAAGMLFPFLLRDWRATVAMIATAAPFTLLAAILSAAPHSRALLAWSYVSLWLVAVSLWRSALPPHLHLTAIAVSNLLTLGLPLLAYLRAEFGPDRPWPWLSISPVIAAPDVLIGRSTYLALGSLIALCAISGLIQLRSRSQSTTYPPYPSTPCG